MRLRYARRMRQVSGYYLYSGKEAGAADFAHCCHHLAGGGCGCSKPAGPGLALLTAAPDKAGIASLRGKLYIG